ncbi:unnamed protein product [Linum trigynum]|uniref:Uncharacterized protein n=1 Tax=Linum trigynum TaxID=586398 RepID=A0AAV2FX68_9ROSI
MEILLRSALSPVVVGPARLLTRPVSSALHHMYPSISNLQSAKSASVKDGVHLNRFIILSQCFARSGSSEMASLSRYFLA